MNKQSDPLQKDELSWPKRLLREPLLHFVLLGAIFFAVYGYRNRTKDAETDPSKIVVSAGKIEHLAALFSRTWQRPPLPEELKGLIDDYVREEVAYREGKALGLDSNDTIIRRRIRQKLEFVADDLVSQLEPSEEQLAAYLSEHSDDFRVDPRYSIQQVFFDPLRHGDDLSETVFDLVVRLNEDSTVDPQELGDRTLLPYSCTFVSAREVASFFGAEFASALEDIEAGSWQGPVKSTYGLHAVRYELKQPESAPALDEVREAVRREWEHARRQELMSQFYQELIDKYDIEVEWPEVLP